MVPSHTTTETPPPEEQVGDTRGPAFGFGRLVPAAFWIFGIWTLIDATHQLLSTKSVPLGTKLIALVASCVYLAAAVGITHNGRRMRMVGWVAVIVSAAGPLIVGLSVLGDGRTVVGRSPWHHFGADYWYIPLILPAVGLVWMWWSNPRRIVEISEQTHH